MFELKFGVSLSGIAEEMSSEVISALAESSIQTFEMNEKSFPEAQNPQLENQMLEMLNERGKKIISYHNPFAPWDDISSVNETTRLEAVEKLTCRIVDSSLFSPKYVVIHPSTEPIDQTKRALHTAQLRKSLMELLPIFEKYDLLAAIEWLPRKCLGNSLESLLEIIAGTNERIGICLDVNHMMDKYSDIPQVVKDLGDSLFTLHISDYDGIDEKHFLPGEGVIDWKAFLEALKTIGYSGPFNYECRIYGDSFAKRITNFENNFAKLNALLD